MQRRAVSKPGARTGTLNARPRRSGVARAGYLAPASGLIGIPQLEQQQAGQKISFGSSSLTTLAASLVGSGFADAADWIAANKIPSTLVDQVLRRFLAERGQPVIAQHFELCFTLGESIIDSVYGEAEPAATGQLFFVLNTESSFALG